MNQPGSVDQPCMVNQPGSVYVHIPFCRHRCGYCNFTLITGRDDLISSYLRALELELSNVVPQPTTVETIFLGGGTPSYLPLNQLRDLLTTVTRRFHPGRPFEFSCEMNPLDCDPERLALLHEFGVNRISLGGQSFDDKKLSALERDHSESQLHAALHRCTGLFSNVSLDLIFAAPEETLSTWQRDLQLANRAPIQHLSTYGLTVERGSAFYGQVRRGEFNEICGDQQLQMYESAIDFLTAEGWEHYEVSSFSRPGLRCRHNEAYWLGEPWWAFGPGAASFLPASPDGSRVRQANHRSTTTYIKKVLNGLSPIAEQDLLSAEQVLRERFVFGLRRLQGVVLDELDEMLGRPARPMFEPYLSRFESQGLLRIDPTRRVQLTRRGLMVSDGMWPDLLQD